MRTVTFLVLEGVDSSGETMRFWAQHESLYWRETWLEPETRTITPAPSDSNEASTSG